VRAEVPFGQGGTVRVFAMSREKLDRLTATCPFAPGQSYAAVGAFFMESVSGQVISVGIRFPGRNWGTLQTRLYACIDGTLVETSDYCIRNFSFPGTSVFQPASNTLAATSCHSTPFVAAYPKGATHVCVAGRHGCQCEFTASSRDFELPTILFYATAGIGFVLAVSLFNRASFVRQVPGRGEHDAEAVVAAVALVGLATWTPSMEDTNHLSQPVLYTLCVVTMAVVVAGNLYMSLRSTTTTLSGKLSHVQPLYGGWVLVSIFASLRITGPILFAVLSVLTFAFRSMVLLIIAWIARHRSIPMPSGYVLHSIQLAVLAVGCAFVGLTLREHACPNGFQLD
jgi:hypothetical protein